MQPVVTFCTRLWVEVCPAPKMVNESKTLPRRMARAGAVKLAAIARITPGTRIGICFLVVNLNGDSQPVFEAPVAAGSDVLPIAKDYHI